jgi:hypothetical protein
MLFDKQDCIVFLKLCVSDKLNHNTLTGEIKKLINKIFQEYPDLMFQYKFLTGD